MFIFQWIGVEKHLKVYIKLFYVQFKLVNAITFLFECWLLTDWLTVVIINYYKLYFRFKFSAKLFEPHFCITSMYSI